MTLIEKLQGLVFIPFLSALIIPILLLIMVVLHDELLITMYDIVSGMVTKSWLSSIWLTSVEKVILVYQSLISSLDLIWFLMFIVLVVNIIYESYMSKRESYFSVFSILTIFLIILLWVGSIFSGIGNTLYDVIISNAITGNITIKYLPFYLQNCGLINSIILIISVVANIIDFDMSRFLTRKDKEGNLNEL